MKIATWNIRAGGGTRTEKIARIILEETPDILVLTEYRPKAGQILLEHIEALPYFVEAGEPVGPQNSVAILSRMPITRLELKSLPKSHHRWMAVHVPARDLDVLGVHVPNQNEIWNKREFWDCVDSFAVDHVGRRAIIIGDLNTALDEDCQGDPIREAIYMKKLLATGWIDAWRTCNADASEFSWFSHRQNGFRIDHCLVSPALKPCVRSAQMRHDVREDRLSDHSLLSVEMDLSSSALPIDKGSREEA